MNRQKMLMLEDNERNGINRELGYGVKEENC